MPMKANRLSRRFSLLAASAGQRLYGLAGHRRLVDGGHLGLVRGRAVSVRLS